MSFVSIGDASATPSFLELVAAHKLDRSIRDAFSYVLSVRPLYIRTNQILNMA